MAGGQDQETKGGKKNGQTRKHGTLPLLSGLDGELSVGTDTKIITFTAQHSRNQRKFFLFNREKHKTPRKE
jgi:hypothetical protein